LNPLKHLDPFGSVLLPILTYSLGGFLVGWAKPVPYNPYNLRPGRWSEAIVAGAGPLVNLAIALAFGLLVRFGASAGLGATLIHLDGSKLLFAFFPQDAQRLRAFFERYSFLLLILFIFFLWQYLSPVIGLIFSLMTGFSL
ncbi:site-2 protease family protein, partial [Candidatus Parcubacteria bacterium]|nr:site-2 protease family protein [Candidatus Parcubacteria bacterium]